MMLSTKMSIRRIFLISVQQKEEQLNVANVSVSSKTDIESVREFLSRLDT